MVVKLLKNHNNNKKCIVRGLNKFLALELCESFINKPENVAFKETLRQAIYIYQKDIINFDKLYVYLFKQERYNKKICKKVYKKFKTVIVKHPENYFENLFKFSQYLLKNKQFLSDDKSIKNEIKEILFVNKPGIKDLEKMYLYLFVEEIGDELLTEEPKLEDLNKTMNHLSKVVKQNNLSENIKLKKINQGLLKDLNDQVGENIEYVKQIRELEEPILVQNIEPSAPPMYPVLNDKEGYPVSMS